MTGDARRNLLADLLTWASLQLAPHLDEHQAATVTDAIAVLRGQPRVCPVCGRVDQLVNQRTAAAALGVSARTLRRATAAGHIAAVRIGRRTLYDLGEVMNANRR